MNSPLRTRAPASLAHGGGQVSRPAACRAVIAAPSSRPRAGVPRPFHPRRCSALSWGDELGPRAGCSARRSAAARSALVSVIAGMAKVERDGQAVSSRSYADPRVRSVRPRGRQLPVQELPGISVSPGERVVAVAAPIGGTPAGPYHRPRSGGQVFASAERSASSRSACRNPPNTHLRRRKAVFRIGRYHFRTRVTKGASCSCELLFKHKLANTGIRVSEINSEATSTKITVHAIGTKHFAFDTFERQNRQVNDHNDQLAIDGWLPNFVGGASTTPTRSVPLECPSRLKMFSTTTTQLSTTIPKSIAPVPKNVPAIPIASMPEKANNIDSGMATATISPALKLPRKKNTTAITSIAPFA